METVEELFDKIFSYGLWEGYGRTTPLPMGYGSVKSSLG